MRTDESIPSYRPRATQGDAWAQTMRVASNQKVARPGFGGSRRGCFASAVSPEKDVQMPLSGAVSRHPATFARASGCPCIFGDEVMQNKKTTRRKIVTHIIDVGQFFLFTTIGERTVAKPPCV
jgi:hypothetical protein